MTKKTTMYGGCHLRPGRKHQGQAWTCEKCGVQACARCSRYFWKRTARSGTVKATRSGFEMTGPRVALCPRCCR